jgi:hypothetical protein
MMVTLHANQRTVKKILHLNTNHVILIRILQENENRSEIHMERIFIGYGEGMITAHGLSDLFNAGRMKMSDLECITTWFVSDPSKRHVALGMGLHKRLGESSRLRLQEEGIVKYISSKSPTGSFNPWKAYDEAPVSERCSSLDALKISLEHAKAIWERLPIKQTHKIDELSWSYELVHIDKQLKEINEYLSKKYATKRDTFPEMRSRKGLRKKSRFERQVESSPEPDEKGQPGSNATQGTLCCLTCGLRIMPDISTLSV